MERKNKGFPFEYYPGEILTEKEAVFRFKMCWFRLMNIGGVVTSNVLVREVMLPSPIPINRIQDSMVSQTKPIYLITPVIPDKNILTDLQLDEFNQISSKFLNGSISIDEAILQLRGEGRFEEICYLALFIWLSSLQNNHLEGFQATRPPHQQWMPNRRPPYTGGYGSSNSRPSLGLTKNKNHKFNEFSQNNIQNAYSQIPTLPVEGTNFQVTAWSAAKHIHYAPQFGLDPTKYGMTQEDLNIIAKDGLIDYIQHGGTPPNSEFVEALQLRWQKFAQHKDVRNCGISSVMSKDCYVLKHDKTGFFLSFKVDTTKSFTGYKLNVNQSLKHDKYGIIVIKYK